MNKPTNKLIPDLRFPEFVNEGEWEEKYLEEVAEVNPSSSQLPNKFVYVDLESVENGTLQKRRIINKEEAPSRAQRLLKEDDVIFQMVRPYQKNNYYFKKKDEFEYVASTGYAQLRAFESSMYLYQFIHTDKFVSKVLKKCTGSNYPAINSSDLSKISIQIPNPKEQQKIASCLSSLDEVLAAHSQKLELLKNHKKGLMQNLFPQMSGTGFSRLNDKQDNEKILSIKQSYKSCSDNVPKYRFPEFENDGEWVEDKLGKLGTFLGGGTPSRTNSEYWLGNIPWISSSDINDDDIHNISISQFINENSIIESATKIIPKGSVLFVSRVGVGKLAINKEDLCTSQDFTSFIPKDVINYFVAYYYSGNKNLLQALSQGTSIKGFSKSDLEDSKILYPKNPKEQQKIASCLSSLDALITAQAEKIEQLKLHKKGLMQDLFPKLITPNSV